MKLEVGTMALGFFVVLLFSFLSSLQQILPALLLLAARHSLSDCAQGVETEAERKEVETGTCSVAMQTGTTVCPAQD